MGPIGMGPNDPRDNSKFPLGRAIKTFTNKGGGLSAINHYFSSFKFIKIEIIINKKKNWFRLKKSTYSFSFLLFCSVGEKNYLFTCKQNLLSRVKDKERIQYQN